LTVGRCQPTFHFQDRPDHFRKTQMVHTLAVLRVMPAKYTLFEMECKNDVSSTSATGN
jgi:hypothetical protein